jgi:hypothetical protein
MPVKWYGNIERKVDCETSESKDSNSIYIIVLGKEELASSRDKFCCNGP